MNRKKTFAYIVFNTLSVTFYAVSFKDGVGIREYTETKSYSGLTERDGLFRYPEEVVQAVSDFIARYRQIKNVALDEASVLLPLPFFVLTPKILSYPVNGVVTKEVLERGKEELRKRFSEYNLSTVQVDGYRCDGKDGFIDDPIGKTVKQLEILSVVASLKKQAQDLFASVSKTVQCKLSCMLEEKPVLKNLSNKVTKGILINMADDNTDILYFERQLPFFGTTVPLGSEDFVELLKRDLGCDRATASRLISAANLGLSAKEGQQYVLPFTGEKFDIVRINGCLYNYCDSIIEEIAKSVEKIIDKEKCPVFLTGSETVSMNGFGDMISARLERDVYIYKPDYCGFTSPSDAVAAAYAEQLCDEK